MLGGDASVFKWVRDVLDHTDDAHSLPVLVLADTGGVAEDIYRYVLGPEVEWATFPQLPLLSTAPSTADLPPCHVAG